MQRSEQTYFSFLRGFGLPSSPVQRPALDLGLESSNSVIHIEVIPPDTYSQNIAPISGSETFYYDSSPKISTEFTQAFAGAHQSTQRQVDQLGFQRSEYPRSFNNFKEDNSKGMKTPLPDSIAEKDALSVTSSSNIQDLLKMSSIRDSEARQSGKKIYECSICYKRHQNEYSRNVHELTHEPDLKCKDCGKRFDSMGGLKYHNEKNVCWNYSRRRQKSLERATIGKRNKQEVPEGEVLKNSLPDIFETFSTFNFVPSAELDLRRAGGNPTDGNSKSQNHSTFKARGKVVTDSLDLEQEFKNEHDPIIEKEFIRHTYKLQEEENMANELQEMNKIFNQSNVKSHEALPKTSRIDNVSSCYDRPHVIMGIPPSLTVFESNDSSNCQNYQTLSKNELKDEFISLEVLESETSPIRYPTCNRCGFCFLTSEAFDAHAKQKTC